MKPRLKPATLTPEDEAAWARAVCVDVALCEWARLWMGYRTADRRDADLMLELGRHWQRPAWEWDARTLHSAWAFQGLRSAELVAA